VERGFPREIEGPVSLLRPAFKQESIYANLISFTPNFNQAGHSIALETFLVVDRDQVSAPAAAVLVVLDLSEAVQPRFPDFLKIFLHTHAIVLPVPFVHTFNPPAGILFAFKTEPGQAE